jgi:hypothetical protein
MQNKCEVSMLGRRSVLSLIIGFAVLGVNVMSAASVYAQADFYKGKTITV